MSQKEIYQPTTSYKLIYIFCVHDDAHKDILKIGDASIDSALSLDQLLSNSSLLNKAARNRINQYSVTLGINPHILHTEIAVRTVVDEDGTKHIESFRDHDVHAVLIKSNIEKVRPNSTNANEWFRTDIETAKNAINAVKESRKSLYGSEITATNKVEIILREEQEDAINKTITLFKHGDQMLWNAKMRYGKTITALSLVNRQLNKYKRTLIITHRPVVQSGWRDDFNLIFKNGGCTFEKKEYETDNPEENSKIDYANEIHLKHMERSGNPFIYFASIQDLRGSTRVGGGHNKNNAVFDMEWDLIINDEAHEGTQTQLGQSVAAAIKKKHTKLLSLSGTPFNIMYQYDDEAVYTWDYVMEQERKNEWDKTHPGDPNPYASLPQMHIFTYELGDIIRGYSPELEGKAFNFSEFFRTWIGDPQKDGQEVAPSSIGEFVHKGDIEKFLRLISTASDDYFYPYSTEEYRDMFRHTLWMIPGVKEAKALSKLLREHPIFKCFGIANVAGEGDDYEETHIQDALDLVKKTIKENDYSITLSCGKLTTGVTIKEWTSCFMMSGSYMTGAASYLQTIFRVQSPGSINGKAKEHCYVFDFAPDRTLRVIAEAAKVSRKGGTGGRSGEEERREVMRKFLNYCPVIAIIGTTMKSYSVDNMMQQIKHIYAERAINSGFDDSSIYNERMMMLDKLDLEDFEKLKKIIGSTKANKATSEVPVNKQGFTEEEYERIQQLKKKSRTELTAQQKEELVRLKKQREEKSNAESILRGVSIRMPLLIFGADVPLSEDITIEKFVTLVDDESWKEFMPKGVSKALFSRFIKYYDKDVFVAAAKEIRLKAKRADGLLPTARVEQIALIHSKFKNPDKETVLTPWRVVNMHMSDCLGGWCFYDETFAEDKKLETPRLVERGEVTKETFSNLNANILEINSKTGLYPLYIAYSIYRARCADYERNAQSTEHDKKPVLTDRKQHELWMHTVQENMFIICKTKMARAITIRTLVGYSDVKVNTHCFDDLVNQMKGKPEQFIKKISRGSFWDKEVNKMKFDAVVGNPPYQLTDGSGGTNDAPIYQHFVEASQKVTSRYASLIIPSRWFTTGRENLLGDFRSNMLNNPGIRMLFAFTNSRDVFPTVEIKGGLCYYLYDNAYSGDCLYTLVQNGKRSATKRRLGDFDILIREPRLAAIVKKVSDQIGQDEETVSSLISTDTPFGIPTNPLSSKKNPITVFTSEGKGHETKLFYLEKMERKIAYIDGSKITKNTADIDKGKVFVPEAGGSGTDPYVIGKPEYCSGNSVSSQTFLYAAFDSQSEAKNFLSYMKTKFFRVLVSACKISQHTPSKAYRFVPLQDFSKPWTDAELYAKYGLTQDEIDFIESLIKPMA